MALASYHSLLILILILILPLMSGAARAADWYVAPSGSPFPDGSISNPWDLKTALNHPAAVKPGDTIYLRGGVYLGKYTSYLTGAAGSPIVVRSYPGEWARIDGFATHITLTQDITAADKLIPVIDASLVQPGGYTRIEGENIYVYKTIGNTLDVLRGWGGAVPKDHAAGTPLTLLGGMLYIHGAHTWYRDFEIMSSDPLRQTAEAGSSPFEITRGGGVTVWGDYIKLIHLVVHDTTDAIFTAEGALETEVYGAILYSNGWLGPDRGHGHGMYLRNKIGVKVFRDVLTFNNHATGQKLFGYAAYGDNVLYEGFTSFNNGEGNFFIGMDEFPSHNIKVLENYIYCPSNAPGGRCGSGMEIGWGGSGVRNVDVVIQGNYIASRGGGGLAVNNWESVVFTGNTVWRSGNNVGSGMALFQTASGVSLSAHTWDSNTYYDNDNPWGNGYTYNFSLGPGAPPNTLGGGNYNYELDWKRLTPFDVNSTYVRGTPGGTPGGVKVFVRPSPYEAGRAHITVFNWDNNAAVDADVTGTGLLAGDAYEVRDAQNFFGPPVKTGTYGGGAIPIPMTHTAVYTAVGNVAYPPVHTPQEFGVFVLMKAGGGGTPVAVALSPWVVTLGASQTQAFTATVSGASNTGVTWSLSPNIGTLSAGGLYTAPATITQAKAVIVTATSQADPTRYARALVTLTPPNTGSLPAPDLSGIDGKTFSVSGEIALSYSAQASGFNWEIDRLPPSSIHHTAAARRSAAVALANIPTAAPRLPLASLALGPGRYTIRVQAVNGAQSSAWAQASVTLVLADLSAARVYPNPWRADRHTGDITFDNLSLGTTIKIFTVSGHLVKELNPAGSSAAWDRRNDSGDSVASGIYLYLITDGQGNRKKGKVALIK